MCGWELILGVDVKESSFLRDFLFFFVILVELLIILFTFVSNEGYMPYEEVTYKVTGHSRFFLLVAYFCLLCNKETIYTL